MIPVWAWLGDALDGSVGVSDSITIVSLHVVSIDGDGVAGGVDHDDNVESVTTVVVPDCVSVVSLHVVSIDMDGSEENVTTVMVPDCVIVLSLHVVSQENKVLGATDDVPIEVVLLMAGSEEACVTVADGVLPDASPEGTEDGLLMLSVPAKGVPTGKVLVWPLNVSAPVPIEVIVGTEDEFAPVVGAVVMLVSEPVATTDETLVGIPDDNEIGFVSELVSGIDIIDVDTVRLPLKLAVASKDETLLVPGPELVAELASLGVEVWLVFVVTVMLEIVTRELDEREPDSASELPGDCVGMPLEFPGTENTLSFGCGTLVVNVVPLIVVGGCVSTVVWVMVVSTAVVKVVPERVVGEIVNVSIVDETLVLALPELSGEPEEAGVILVRVEFVTGYGAVLEGRTDMAEELPLALVRLAPEEDSEVRGVPEDIDNMPVIADVVDTPPGTEVGLVRLDELVVWNGGKLDEGQVELLPVLVSNVEVAMGGVIFVPEVRVPVVFDGCVAKEDGT
ncbi:hypothetical protein ONZ43_g177 [Nemania bipapillata]|uniref:Uncharacterized protein n=1 Tax=Nemania bipapillata TaxID=110536 RepID=A0ACC2J9B7_9PEZI|nr:hypothetical protein ONZ43_g177 [Nemania bipapillata]